jgi:hypothetical protein
MSDSSIIRGLPGVNTAYLAGAVQNPGSIVAAGTPRSGRSDRRMVCWVAKCWRLTVRWAIRCVCTGWIIAQDSKRWRAHADG